MDTSTPEDRLALILKAYSIARDQQDQDIAEADSDEQAVDRLDTSVELVEVEVEVVHQVRCPY